MTQQVFRDAAVKTTTIHMASPGSGRPAFSRGFKATETRISHLAAVAATDSTAADAAQSLLILSVG